MKQIFINLPVADLNKAMNFYLQLGFKSQALFTGKNQGCMLWCDQVMVMLQTKEFFSTGCKKQLANTGQSLSASFTLPVESTVKVNEMMDKALNAGGKEHVPMLEETFMYLRGFEDLDGHVWSIIHLDMDNFRKRK